MKDLLEELMDTAAGRADYADARYVRSRGEELATRNGAVDEVETSESEGVGVRVRVGGAWGFAATRELDRAALERALDQALAIASAQPRAPATPLAPEPPARGRWESRCQVDPFSVPLEEKLDALVAADLSMRGDDRIAVTSATFMAYSDNRVFASTEGALCEQHTVECGGGLTATAVGGDEVQRRSFPSSFNGNVAQAGYEYFRELGLEAAGPRTAEEAVALLTAPKCPAGTATIILDSQQVALQVHESVGHAVELDRVLGTEASYAGTSFVELADVGSLRYGSDQMNVTADATTPHGLGTFGWDDEGVEGRREPIVRHGVLYGFLSSRESAAEVGLARSGGCMRASGFDRQPIVRMTNVNLEPGEAGSLDDLLADSGDGLLIETNRSWSIDNRRLHFQFEGEAAWEIRGGERGRLLRNPSYAGVTPEFWGSCDAVCSADEWSLISLLDCGKGEPGQVMRVSHGTAPARFRNVEVGVA
jgi:TldD protein